MTLSQATLVSDLENMVPTLVEHPGPDCAADHLSLDYADYMKGATANGITITASAVDSIAKPAMHSAMDFRDPETSAEVAQLIVDGVNAFWATMVAAPASFFTGATAITAPPFTGLAAALEARFDDVRDNKKTLAQFAALAGADIHSETYNKGSATIGGTPWAIL